MALALEYQRTTHTTSRHRNRIPQTKFQHYRFVIDLDLNHDDPSSIQILLRFARDGRSSQRGLLRDRLQTAGSCRGTHLTSLDSTTTISKYDVLHTTVIFQHRSSKYTLILRCNKHVVVCLQVLRFHASYVVSCMLHLQNISPITLCRDERFDHAMSASKDSVNLIYLSISQSFDIVTAISCPCDAASSCTLMLDSCRTRSVEFFIQYISINHTPTPTGTPHSQSYQLWCGTAEILVVSFS